MARVFQAHSLQMPAGYNCVAVYILHTTVGSKSNSNRGWQSGQLQQTHLEVCLSVLADQLLDKQEVPLSHVRVVR